MSKVSFRARQIDFNKPLPILKYDSEIFSELSENALVNRGVPQLPSGMEKDEENEHHFLEVLQALQNRKTTEDVHIPVPEIVDEKSRFDQLYPNGFNPPKQFIHIRTIVLAEEEPIDYDIDTEDEEWLKKCDLNITSDKFETMIDKLERGCGQKVMNLEEAKYLLQDEPSLVIAVYDYWLNKRFQSRQPLMLNVRQEKRDGGSNNDPYVAFRRRTERMQTRKNRKNDEQSYEKMLILREQMKSLGEIMGRLVKRENTKSSLVQNEREILRVRYETGDWDASKYAEADYLVRRCQKTNEALPSTRVSKETTRKRSNRKRKLVRRPHGLSSRTMSSDDASDADNEEDLFAFKRMPGCKYLKPCGDLLPDPRLLDNRLHNLTCYRLTSIPVEHSDRQVYTGYVRRRLGRGGRVIFDRTYPPSGTLRNYLSAYDKLLGSFVPDEQDISANKLEQHMTNNCMRHRRLGNQLHDYSHRLQACALSEHPGRLSHPLRFLSDNGDISSQLSTHSHSIHNQSRHFPGLSDSLSNVRALNSEKTNHSSNSFPLLSKSFKLPSSQTFHPSLKGFSTATLIPDCLSNSGTVSTKKHPSSLSSDEVKQSVFSTQLDGANSRYLGEAHSTTSPAHVSSAPLHLPRTHDGLLGCSTQTLVADADVNGARLSPAGVAFGARQTNRPGVKTTGYTNMVRQTCPSLLTGASLSVEEVSSPNDKGQSTVDSWPTSRRVPSTLMVAPASPLLSVDNGFLSPTDMTAAGLLKVRRLSANTVTRQRVKADSGGSLDRTDSASSSSSTASTAASSNSNHELRTTSGGFSPTQVC